MKITDTLIMRFRTRVFLWWLIPVAVLLSLSFWAIESMVQTAVHTGLRDSLRQNHSALSALRARADVRNSRFLRIAGENTALKAGLQLLLVESSSPAAQATLEDELLELCERMGFDLFVASSRDSTPLAGVARIDGKLRSMSRAALPAPGEKIFPLNSRIYQTSSVPIELNGEILGILTVGEILDLSAFSTPVVLLHGKKVLQSSLPRVSIDELEIRLQSCPGLAECDIQLAGVTYLSMPMQNAALGEGYSLRSLQNVDAAIQPVRAVLRWLFISVFAGAVILAVFCGALSARSIVRPISALVDHLRHVDRTGLIPAFHVSESGIREIEELTRTFNNAAATARAARENLDDAYVQFVATLAMALDARDRYTAGHSHRVSVLSCRIAEHLGLPKSEIERVRMGALLHDIGKIGISDTVLQKAGPLTDLEMATIRQHPEIGRRILEKVQGFSDWLDAVELHHENWDGTGYPHGLRAEQVPIDARIVHVADAYDAMTTDRPYRKGMEHEWALINLQARAGLDFDPDIVQCVMKLDAAPAVAVLTTTE